MDNIFEEIIQEQQRYPTLLSVVLDENNYITEFCTGGFLQNETLHIETIIPDNFIQYYQAYQIINDTLIFDDTKINNINHEIELNELRGRREIECFSITDRGELWYSHLTQEQLTELNSWYEAWLNVTETKIIPEKPSWLV